MENVRVPAGTKSLAPRALEQGQARRRQATAETKPCVVDQNQIANRGPQARSRVVQFGDRQQLRGCDVVAVRVDDVAPSGYSMDRATVRQKKTGRPVGSS